MSALKSWDTSLQIREKRTLLYFGVLYFSLSLAILSLFSIGYFFNAKDAMLQNMRLELNVKANTQVEALRKFHIDFDKTRLYPRNDEFNSGIFDADGVEIFSLLKTTPELFKIIYLKNGLIHYIKEPQSHYLGTKYLVLEVEDDGLWRDRALKYIAYFWSISLFILGVGGYFLLKLFLKPMKEAIALLDRFIKDTTHELNTPINAILTNIEMLEDESLDKSVEQKLNRIKIGAMTVANLYQDLTYLTLGHKIASSDERVEMYELLKERLEYVKPMCDSKRLKTSIKGDESFLFIDRKKISKLVDNLLSNAIKYNKVGGEINIRVFKNHFQICDSGRGIDPDKLKDIFKRYSRANSSVGGFGIGLSIVSAIAKEYGLEMELNSTKEGTCIDIFWD
ncbi:MAG: HAMP domain-containing sensor histidine kinase [Campylobacterales bacterium]|nr:HAMP domain-containing sensor histidine kinase [Campylobacterales bacterium]